MIISISKFTIHQEKREKLLEFELPVRIALGAADYLVVDTMEVAKNINSILRERGIKKDVWILENIPKAKKELNANLIGNRGLLAENKLRNLAFG